MDLQRLLLRDVGTREASGAVRAPIRNLAAACANRIDCKYGRLHRRHCHPSRHSRRAASAHWSHNPSRVGATLTGSTSESEYLSCQLELRRVGGPRGLTARPLPSHPATRPGSPRPAAIGTPIPGPGRIGKRDFPVSRSGNGTSLFPGPGRIGKRGIPVSRFWPNRETGIPSPISGQIGNRGNGNWGFGPLAHGACHEPLAAAADVRWRPEISIFEDERQHLAPGSRVIGTHGMSIPDFPIFGKIGNRGSLIPESGQVRFITRPKSRTMRVTRQLMLPPSTVT